MPNDPIAFCFFPAQKNALLAAVVVTLRKSPAGAETTPLSALRTLCLLLLAAALLPALGRPLPARAYSFPQEVLDGRVEASRRPLILGALAMEFPPFFTFRDGKAGGLCVDRVRAAVEHMGLEVQFLSLPWNRMLLMVQNGEIDGVVGILYTPERAEYLEYVPTPLAVMVDRLFTCSQCEDISWDGDLRQLQGRPVATVKGYSHGREFDQAQFLNKRPCIDDRQMIHMVLSGRFAAGVAPASVVRHHAKELGLKQNLVILDPPVQSNPLFLALSRRSGLARLVPLFSEALAREVSTPLGIDGR